MQHLRGSGIHTGSQRLPRHDQRATTALRPPEQLPELYSSATRLQEQDHVSRRSIGVSESSGRLETAIKLSGSKLRKSRKAHLSSTTRLQQPPEDHWSLIQATQASRSNRKTLESARSYRELRTTRNSHQIDWKVSSGRAESVKATTTDACNSTGSILRSIN